MGSRLVEYQKNIDWLRAAYPGIYVKNINLYPGPPSTLTKMKPQFQRLVMAIKADRMLQDGFNLYGESQGALLARVYVSEHNDPPVYNLIAVSGPQSGVGACPTIEIPGIKEICERGAGVLDIYQWPKCSFCDYWKGVNEDKYLRLNQWLKDVNNEVAQKDMARSQRMATLNMYMASAGSADKVVQPRESAWHTFWPWGKRTNVMDLHDTEGYKGDWLGLNTLDKQGKLILNMYEGEHTSYNKSWWNEVVKPMFNNKLQAVGKEEVL
jgi:palmitoyl-protein thioesterase